MHKLFIFQDNADSKYAQELKKIYNILKTKYNISYVQLDEIDINELKNIDVVISNELPYKWRVILKGLKIVSVVFGSYIQVDDYADIIIDFRYNSNNRLFTGEKFKVANHMNLDIKFIEIFELISELNWDSKFWGFKVAYVSSRQLSECILFRIDKFIKDKQIRLVEYLCNCHDKKSVELAEKNGFEFKDIRLTYEKKISQSNIEIPNQDIILIKARNEHIEELRNLSNDIYKDSRYYYDNNFDNSKTIEFYMSWAEKAVKGEYDDECYIIEKNSEMLGFCTVKYKYNGLAQIGLVGISKNHTGKGIGGKLLTLFFSEMKKRGVIDVHVVTQGRNYSAQRLYQRAGFLTYSTEIWYHKWIY